MTETSFERFFIEQLTLKPGDILVVKCDGVLSDNARMWVANNFYEQLVSAGIEKPRFIVIDSQLSLGTISEADAPIPDCDNDARPKAEEGE